MNKQLQSILLILSLICLSLFFMDLSFCDGESQIKEHIESNFGEDDRNFIQKNALVICYTLLGVGLILMFSGIYICETAEAAKK